MAIITMGPGAIDRAQSMIDEYTNIELTNPADGTGTIDEFEVWFRVDKGTGEGVKVGIFYGAGADYTSRDVEIIAGSVAAGSKQTFSGLDLDVVLNDLLGIYYDVGGEVERDVSGGVGYYYKSGDQFGAGVQTYALSNTYILSIKGTGTTSAGWTGKVSGVTNPAKVLGVAKANIGKVMGVS